jgi:hypothetical protein
MNECRQLPCIVCSNLTPIQAVNTYGECETCAPIMDLKRILEKQGKVVKGNGDREARLPYHD